MNGQKSSSGTKTFLNPEAVSQQRFIRISCFCLEVWFPWIPLDRQTSCTCCVWVRIKRRRSKPVTYASFITVSLNKIKLLNLWPSNLAIFSIFPSKISLNFQKWWKIPSTLFLFFWRLSPKKATKICRLITWLRGRSSSFKVVASTFLNQALTPSTPLTVSLKKSFSMTIEWRKPTKVGYSLSTWISLVST